MSQRRKHKLQEETVKCNQKAINQNGRKEHPRAKMSQTVITGRTHREGEKKKRRKKTNNKKKKRKERKEQDKRRSRKKLWYMHGL